MRKFEIYFRALLAVLFVLPFTQSCSDDSEPQKIVSPATVKVLSSSEYYFLLDSGKKLYPANAVDISDYTAEEGRRVIVYCYLLEEKTNGYDYSGEIIYIEEIPTKEIILMSDEIAEIIGTDPINITSWWYAGNCINFEYKYLGTRNPTQEHTVNLVYGISGGDAEEKGYLALEFRHNAHEDPMSEYIDGIVSFRMPSLVYDSNIGLKVKVTTLYQGVKYRKMDF